MTLYTSDTEYKNRTGSADLLRSGTAYLIASALCLFRAAHVNLKKSSALAAHLANLETMQA